MELKLSTRTPSTEHVEVGTLLRICICNEEARCGEWLWVRVTEAHDSGSFTGTFVTPSTIREVSEVRIGDTVQFDRHHIEGRTRQPDSDHEVRMFTVSDDHRAYVDVMEGLEPDSAEGDGSEYSDSYRLWSAALAVHENDAHGGLTEIEADLLGWRLAQLAEQATDVVTRRSILNYLAIEGPKTEAEIAEAVRRTGRTCSNEDCTNCAEDSVGRVLWNLEQDDEITRKGDRFVIAEIA